MAPEALSLACGSGNVKILSIDKSIGYRKKLPTGLLYIHSGSIVIEAKTKKGNTLSLDRRLCVAPMLDWTDRHERFFLRLITRHTLLYTEMVTTGALLHGDKERFLAYDPSEHPIALQLGGNDPQALAECARLAEDYGYDEINLNCGCPSQRVQSGQFGACLLANPARVAQCVAAMCREVSIPVTVKTRIGINEQGINEHNVDKPRVDEWDIDEGDSYRHLADFIETVAEAGCNTFIIHARKAWLGHIPTVTDAFTPDPALPPNTRHLAPHGYKNSHKKRGLNPSQNRAIPPLRYDVASNLKKMFPTLAIVLNGGVTDLESARAHLDVFDGVMIGRAAYHHA
ncbi:MAG: tRNA dihydrouridine(20/20a) synthase DusA, partial [Gammaproteobacteria bacterium]|nr:tRNA dihydrouridine(20/20a) synthase DusA [Gammaproteobacteria bacterium]